MASLREIRPEPGESLADFTERLAVVFQAASTAAQECYRAEIRGLIRTPEAETLGVGLVGKLDIVDRAPIIFQRLTAPGLPAGDYNRYLIALGQLFYEPAASTIEAQFLRGKTKAAASVALLLIDPARAKAPFRDYAQRKPDEGTALAGVGLLEYHGKKGLAGIESRVDAIPDELIRGTSDLFYFPAGLTTFLNSHKRLT